MGVGVLCRVLDLFVALCRVLRVLRCVLGVLGGSVCDVSRPRCVRCIAPYPRNARPRVFVVMWVCLAPGVQSGVLLEGAILVTLAPS